MRLVLASASPRRAQLLRAAGFAFDVCPADLDESLHDGEPPERYVRRLAAEKSAAVAGRVGADAVVIGADTAVVVDGVVLSKPIDDDDAAAMLRRLSGRRHEVLTGVSVRAGSREVGGVETTSVYFAALDAADIAWYVESGEGRDKAGGYAIQGLASRFIPRVDGSYSNVVGLPVTALVALLGALLRPGWTGDVRRHFDAS